LALATREAAMAALTLRVRGPSGQSTLSLPAGGTVAELTAAVAERTGVELARLELRSGFPLRVLEWRSADAAAAAAAALGLQPGDSLQASESATPAAEPAPTASDAELLSDGSGFAVQRRIMASDNSCLFRAVAYLSSQERISGGELRRVVADAVLADPERFCEPVLGKSPADYAAWILLDDSWGGAIELAILSEKLGFEICAADVQTQVRGAPPRARATLACFCATRVQCLTQPRAAQRVDRYGQGNYKERGWVLYDGAQCA
jgi:ubiquitin thioesterase OTU1